ncbi:MAG: HAD family hydrolase [Roseburia sp.]|nr:HAD family hydrolase [Anaeroplasma bactoclasticum]MCM1195978.1 HAD family hydrolase [Roseburia sp.]MCM1556410.1 HAD family hydrolase [Anaeroplasma bactoclasticum]
MKAILFDLYGTLIDIHTDEDSITFWKQISKKVKKYCDYTPKELKNKYMHICREQGKEKEEIEILEVFEELFSITKQQAKEVAWQFRKASTKYIHLYRGVKKLLKKVKKEGYSLYVLSNAQEAFTLPELKKLKIEHYFEGIAISSAYGIKKPNLEFFRLALKNFKLDKAIMIGNDLKCDILPAKELGLNHILIESNLTPINEEEDKIIGFQWKKIFNKILAINLGNQN